MRRRAHEVHRSLTDDAGAVQQLRPMPVMSGEGPPVPPQLVVADDLVVGVADRCGVGEREVRDIEEVVGHLGRRCVPVVHRNTGEAEFRITPFRHLGQGGDRIVDRHPHESVPFHDRRRRREVGRWWHVAIGTDRRDLHALAAAVEAPAVIGAADHAGVDRAGGQRCQPMRTPVGEHGPDVVVSEQGPVLAKKSDGMRFRTVECLDFGHGMPTGAERRVLVVEPGGGVGRSEHNDQRRDDIDDRCAQVMGSLARLDADGQRSQPQTGNACADRMHASTGSVVAVVRWVESWAPSGP